MGVIAVNEGVLKLVFPGRYVEIHRQPITASEVMRKNTRHCVTRPDVFQNPWIVVRPESVLQLGRVFFVLPKYTLYKLLKARGFHHHKQSSPQDTRLLRNTLCITSTFLGRGRVLRSTTVVGDSKLFRTYLRTFPWRIPRIIAVARDFTDDPGMSPYLRI